jgi:methyltransferase (TIGR00027 family)
MVATHGSGMTLIRNVSDTARWVAWYRGIESERPDAHFHDPFARRLAGPEGEAIARSIPNTDAVNRSIVVRTVIFDQIVMDRVQHHGVDLVLNLAAGLDARPWRLPLPPALHWIDVDLPEILNYKTETLRDDRPVCRYEAIVADLAIASEAEVVFRRAATGHQRVLVITEGLLIYLEREQVATLGRALHQHSAFRRWLTDMASPMLLEFIGRSRGTMMENAPFKFAPAEGAEFFRALGWEEELYHSTIEAARRLGRPMPRDWIMRLLGPFMPPARLEALRRMSGIDLFRRIDP